MGRPATGSVSTFPQELQEALLDLRKLHPGWGPATLLVALKMDAYWGDQPLPSRAHIARLLKQAGLTRRYQPHHELIQPPRTHLTSPHQEWQMDATCDHAGGWGGQGEFDQHRRCRQSLASAESYPSLETTNPALADYQLSLRRAFLTHGLPETLTLDHGTVFYDNTTPSPFPTRLHLWLLALGIQVRFTRHPLSHRPCDHRTYSPDDDGSSTARTNLYLSH